MGFEATLVGHCYAKLKNPRTLTPTQLTGLRNYQPGDDWLALVKQLAPVGRYTEPIGIMDQAATLVGSPRSASAAKALALAGDFWPMFDLAMRGLSKDSIF